MKLNTFLDNNLQVDNFTKTDFLINTILHPICVDLDWYERIQN